MVRGFAGKQRAHWRISLVLSVTFGIGVLAAVNLSAVAAIVPVQWRVTSDGDAFPIFLSERSDQLFVGGVLRGTISTEPGVVSFGFPGRWMRERVIEYTDADGSDTSDILVLINQINGAFFFYGSDDNNGALPLLPMPSSVDPADIEFRSMTLLADGTAEDIGNQDADVISEPASSVLLFGIAVLATFGYRWKLRGDSA